MGTPLIRLIKFKRHIVLSLLILETCRVNVMFLHISQTSTLEVNYFYMLIVFLVGEAVLGLALLVAATQRKSQELRNPSVLTYFKKSLGY